MGSRIAISTNIDLVRTSPSHLYSSVFNTWQDVFVFIAFELNNGAKSNIM